MWILSTGGFLSVVRKDGDNELTVRARVREDLEALRDHYIPRLKIVETPHADYRFRAKVSREEFAQAIHAMVLEIDYPNFKDAVGKRQGKQRSRLYGKVWSVLYELQGVCIRRDVARS